MLLRLARRGSGTRCTCTSGGFSRCSGQGDAGSSGRHFRLYQTELYRRRLRGASRPRSVSGVDTRLYSPAKPPLQGQRLEVVLQTTVEGKGRRSWWLHWDSCAGNSLSWTTLAIIGTGAAAFQSYLSDEIRRHGCRTASRWTFRAADELAESLRRADIFVFPSIWDEPFSITLVAAMASGAAIVALAPAVLRRPYATVWKGY